MKILVYGAGAVGSLLGGLLAARNDVTLIGRDPHMATIARDGLWIEGARAAHVWPTARNHLLALEDADVVLVAVRATQTADAARALGPAIGGGTTVVTVQNGLGNWEILRQALSSQSVLAAPVTTGAMIRAPGRVAYTGVGRITVGADPAAIAPAQRVADLFRAVGVDASAVPDIRGALWQKAIVNAAINPLSALTGLTNGQLVERPELARRMRAVVDEAVAVCRGLGVALPESDAWSVVERVAKATYDTRSSMQQALAQGRRTEVDAITGRIVAEARRLGVAVPENAALLEDVHRLERERSAR